MAINPPSDIVLGVANAADPQKLRAAAADLARAGGGAIADGAGTADAQAGLLSPASWSPTPEGAPAFDPQALALGQQPGPSAQTTAAKRTPDAYTKFEAFLIQTFVESMMPSDAPDVFGSGTAGKVWKSMLAEHLADEMAKSTSFGIADRIAKRRPGKAAAPGLAAAEPQQTGPGDPTSSAVTDTRQQRFSTPARPLAASSSRRGVG